MANIKKDKKSKGGAEVVPKNSTEITLLDVIDAGKSVYVRNFGGCFPGPAAGSIILLEWGDDVGGWEFIRGGCGVFDFTINQDFLGDGVKRLRVQRVNEEGSDFPMPYWVEAVVR